MSSEIKTKTKTKTKTKDTKTFEEVVLEKNPDVFNYVYNLGDRYLFINSIKKDSDGKNVFEFRHVDIRTLLKHEMTTEQFLRAFKTYSMNKYGIVGGSNKTRGKKSRKNGVKNKTSKRGK